MKWLKNLSHPHAYIIFFILISILAFIKNGLGWRHNMDGLTKNYLWLYFFYILFYFLGYYFRSKKVYVQEKTEVSYSTLRRFQYVYFICAIFFILKFVYISGIPILSDNRIIRTKVSNLGGFVDFPTKAISILGIVAYYLYTIFKKKRYLIEFIFSILLNFLFAERALIVFTIIGAIIIYINYNIISRKIFRVVLISGALILFLIGWIQIVRHGGKDHLNLSGEMSTLEVVAWVVHGDLTGSQKFGAYVVDNLDGEKLNGRYTFGIFASVFIPGYKDHGATYLQKTYYPKATTAQSSSIPYSYYIDFGALSLILPFIIGYISRFFYEKFKPLNSPIYIILYTALYFNLLWSVRAGNFPIEPKLVYFMLVLIYIFNPKSKYKFNNELIQLLRLLFLFTIAISIFYLIIRW